MYLAFWAKAFRARAFWARAFRARAFRARVLAAGALGVAVVATAAVGIALTGPGPALRARADVFIRPGAVHLEREVRQGPSDTLQCQQSLHINCYNPAQIQQAYNLPTLYSRGITGKGTTIVIVDPYGSPTITSDLRTFDSTESIPDPPSLRVIRPAGKVPSFNQNNAGMTGWASETTLDVEYAHTIAPGAKILLVETPGGASAGDVSMSQVITAEKYVIAHRLGSVISQSFVATEQSIGYAGIRSLRGAYTAAYAHHVTVLSGSGDSGAAGFEANGSTYYTHAVTGWPASDPLVTAVGGTQLNLDATGNRNSADTVWNDTYSSTANQLVIGDNGPNPLAGGGGKSVIFGRPSYQNTVSRVVADHRGVPDISMSAACNGAVNIYQSFAGQSAGWYALCGTSEATPLFAGIVALADQVAGHSLGLINPALYKLAARHAPGIVRVTSGNNSVSFRQGGRNHTVRGYSARPGYNLAAGLGTVNAADFVPELARLAR
jgi:subtilase family serine protease